MAILSDGHEMQLLQLSEFGAPQQTLSVTNTPSLIHLSPNSAAPPLSSQANVNGKMVGSSLGLVDKEGMSEGSELGFTDVDGRFEGSSLGSAETEGWLDGK